MTLFFRDFFCQAQKTFKFSDVFRVRSRNPKKAKIAQKRLVRLITKAHYLANTAPLFSQLKVLDIFSINSFSVATFMYSYHHNLLPNSFHDLFLSSNQVHQYETRLASQYRPHFHKTNIKQFSILYRGPQIWNSLPISLISSPSISVLKKKLKNYLTDSRSVV